VEYPKLKPGASALSHKESLPNPPYPILHFRTYTAGITGLSLLASTSGYWFDIMNAKSEYCSRLLGRNGEDKPLAPNMELVLLFQTRSHPSRSYPTKLQNLTGQNPDVDTSFDPLQEHSSAARKGGWEWNLLILMLIEWQRDVAERVSTAMMYEEDYVKLKPEIKHISLI
jgi:hypothetical protein